MTDTRKQSLSALIDGEASELEVHRLLREFNADDSLTISWARYQHIRTTVRGEPGSGTQLDPASHELLLRRISESVDAEETHSRPAAAPSQRKIVAGSVALAASLVVAVFIGVQQPGDTAPAVVAGPVAGSLVGGTVPGAAPIPVQTVATQSALADTPELIELDEDKQRQLRAYLNQHDRLSRMNVNRQFVNYNKESSGK